MNATYTEVIFPQAFTGFTWDATSNNSAIMAYGASIPSGLTMQGAIYPVAWNPASSVAANRTCYLVDASGTVSYETAMENAIGLANVQASQSATLRQDFLSAVQSAPITINGTNYQIDLSGPNATGNLASASASQILIMRNQQWAASTAVTAMQSYAVVAGSLLICSTSGTTGTAAPTPPTAFGTPVTDGTAAWELYGRSFDLVGGGTVTLTAQEIITATMQIEAYIHAMKQQRGSLLAQIAAATTVADVQAIVWP